MTNISTEQAPLTIEDYGFEIPGAEAKEGKTIEFKPHHITRATIEAIVDNRQSRDITGLPPIQSSGKTIESQLLS